MSTNEQFGFLEAVNLLLQKKKVILFNVIVVTVLATVVAFILPKRYIANTTVLPPKNNDPFSAFASGGSSMLSKLGSIRSLGVMNEDMYKYVAILQSRSLLGRVLDRFSLQKIYEIEDRGEAMEALKGNIKYTANEEGTLSIFVEDGDPARAFNMAQYVIVLLDSLNRDLSLREARSNAAFIESRVELNLADMEAAENALKDFQEKHGVIPVTTEVSQSADAMAQLYTEKMMKEFEVDYLRQSLGDTSPLYESASLQLQMMNKKMSTMPDLGIKSFRLLRDFLVQQKIYELLMPLYEQAKIMENKNTPTVLILDAPMMPTKAASPRKMIIVIVFFLFSLALSIFFVILQGKYLRYIQRNPEKKALYADLAINLVSWRKH